MKYKELLQHLQQLNEDQLNMDVFICDYENEEYHLSDIEFGYAPCDSVIFGLDQPIIKVL